MYWVWELVGSQRGCGLRGSLGLSSVKGLLSHSPSSPCLPQLSAPWLPPSGSRVRPPWDHHRELWLLPVRGLDRSRTASWGLCNRLLRWRCPGIRGNRHHFRPSSPTHAQECPRIRELPACPRRCCRCRGPGPRFACHCGEGGGKPTPLPGSKAKVLEEHPVWHSVVLTSPSPLLP